MGRLCRAWPGHSRIMQGPLRGAALQLTGSSPERTPPVQQTYGATTHLPLASTLSALPRHQPTLEQRGSGNMPQTLCSKWGPAASHALVLDTESLAESLLLYLVTAVFQLKPCAPWECSTPPALWMPGQCACMHLYCRLKLAMRKPTCLRSLPAQSSHQSGNTSS